jgi:hypothetical protein
MTAVAGARIADGRAFMDRRLPGLPLSLSRQFGLLGGLLEALHAVRLTQEEISTATVMTLS